jgi:hypothetical protein
MTLYLELWDSANTLLARVIDAQADPQSYGQISSSVSNRAAADRIMSGWAKGCTRRSTGSSCEVARG